MGNGRLQRRPFSPRCKLYRPAVGKCCTRQLHWLPAIWPNAVDLSLSAVTRSRKGRKVPLKGGSAHAMWIRRNGYSVACSLADRPTLWRSRVQEWQARTGCGGCLRAGSRHVAGGVHQLLQRSDRHQRTGGGLAIASNWSGYLLLRRRDDDGNGRQQVGEHGKKRIISINT